MLFSVRTLSLVDVGTAAVLSGFAGLVIGVFAVLAVRYSERQMHEVPEPA